MYLRHEAGHALHNCRPPSCGADATGHRPSAASRRQYRDVYNPNPWSRDYVRRNLHRAGMYHYAQQPPPTRTGPRRSPSGWTRRSTGGAIPPRVAGGVRQARVRRSGRRHRALVPRQPAERPPRHARAVPHPTSRRPSPSTSTSATSSTRTCSSTGATCWGSSRADRRARAAFRRARREAHPARPPRPTRSRRRASSSSAERYHRPHQPVDRQVRGIPRDPALLRGQLQPTVRPRAWSCRRKAAAPEARRDDRRRDLARRRQHSQVS